MIIQDGWRMIVWWLAIVSDCLRMMYDCRQLSYTHRMITKDLATSAIMDNRWLSVNGRRLILVNGMTSCCKSEELWVNIGDQKWSATATVWWRLLKPLVEHLPTHRQGIKYNLRLLPTKLIGSRFSVLHQHPAADNNRWETYEDLWMLSTINKN